MANKFTVYYFCVLCASSLIHNVLTQDSSVKTNADRDLLEKEVLGLRVWMIIGIVGLALTVVVVILCCVFDCRIPRSKAEIEAEQENALLIKKYKDTIERIPKGKKVKVIKAIPSSALPGIGLVSQSDGEVQAGTSTELTDSGETNSSSTPLAQHPSTLLTGGNEPHLRKPLAIAGATIMRPGLVATVRTLASMQQLHKQVKQKELQKKAANEKV